jgi:hypothetical protein
VDRLKVGAGDVPVGLLALEREISEVGQQLLQLASDLVGDGLGEGPLDGVHGQLLIWTLYRY